MKCKKCGADLAPDAKFCRECGEKVTIENSPAFCRECGHKLPLNAKFCPGCGAKVVPISVPDTDSPTGVKVPEKSKSKQTKEVVPPPIPDEEKSDGFAFLPSSGSTKTGYDESSAQRKRKIAAEAPLKTETDAAAEFSPKAMGAAKKGAAYTGRKFKEFWNTLSTYSRFMTVCTAILVLLSLIAFCAGKILAGVIGLIQIVLLVGSWLMHFGKLQEFKPNMQKYLLIAAAVLLLPHFLTYAVGEKTSVPPNTAKITESAQISEKRETIPATELPVTTEPVETTEPICFDNEPELYCGTWAFAYMEQDGVTTTNQELLANGDNYLDSYRIVFRKEGFGCVYEKSGTTEFLWRMIPNGITVGKLQATLSDDYLCIPTTESTMFLTKTSSKQSTPEEYAAETESVVVNTLTETEPESTEETGNATEEPTEAVTEAAATEATTEVVTEAGTEAPTEAVTEAAAEAATVPSTEVPDTSEKKGNITHSVYYSSNNADTVRKGNSGVYAYKSRGGAYDRYYIIDFNSRCVYYFTDGNGESSCECVKMESGHLNDVLIITYHDGSDQWSNGLHFKYKDNPEHLIMQDQDGFEYDFYPTDLIDAQRIKGQKTIHNY